ncbi:MAG TPA: hypothetical protein VKH19_10740 [Gemmatimonadaceae bacterium]|nr:hypothetical protein [Gemmatimonadaceae bacterium]
MRSKCYVGAAICMACIAARARAQSATDSATFGCYQGAIAVVRAKRPQTVMVRIADTPLRRDSKNSETRVHSEGLYVEQREGPWHRFTYDCRYSERTARAQVTVSFEGADAERGAPR